MPWRSTQSTKGRVVPPQAAARDGLGYRPVDMKERRRTGDMEKNSGKKRNKDKWKKCRKEKGKGDHSQEAATTVANGDTQHGTAPAKENGSKGSATRVGCRDSQQSIVQKGIQKGSRKEKGKMRTSGNGEKGKGEPEK